jgi:acetolactate synthase-like protein
MSAAAAAGAANALWGFVRALDQLLAFPSSEELRRFAQQPANLAFAMLLVLLATLLSLAVLSALRAAAALARGKLEWLLASGRLDKLSPKNGGELVAEVLKAHGVRFVFTLVGGHVSPILVESEKRGMRVIDTRHEVTAAFAADAVARLTGVPGVCVVTAGPGLTNTVTAVKNAQMAESPLVLLGGAAATMLKGRGALQDIDQISLFKPICKWTATVRRVRDIVGVLREAFQRAQEGVPGPVFVEFPIDVLYPIKDVCKAYGAPVPGEPPKAGKKGGGGLGAAVVQAYLNHHVRYLFAGAWERHDFSPLPFSVPLASDVMVADVARLLLGAKRPLLLIGSQATLPPARPDALRKSVEQLGVPCFLGGMARGLLGRDGELQIRQRRGEALKDADVVILAGIIPDFRLDYGRVLSRRSRIVAVNRNPECLTKNTDLFWKPALAVLGDPGDFLVRLAAAVAPHADARQQEADWVAKLRQRNDERERAIAEKAEAKTEKGMNPLRLLQRVEALLDPQCLMVADGGDFVGSAAYIVRPRGPLKWLDPGAFGTLGVGGGFALGAKLVNPDLQVVILYGDGSLGYSVAEFDTFTRHKVPVIAIVGNDACWTQIAREQVPMFKSSVACDLAFTDYHVVADGFGGRGFLLEREADLPALLEQANKACEQEKKPALLNAIIGKTDFREGSISV